MRQLLLSRLVRSSIACAVLMTSSATAHAQTAAQPLPGIAIGAVAPDFSLAGATRYGTLGAPVRLSDYRGQTVVLAFFYKARTKG
jgi:peroxiredoxin Q/BCP